MPARGSRTDLPPGSLCLGTYATGASKPRALMGCCRCETFSGGRYSRRRTPMDPPRRIARGKRDKAGCAERRARTMEDEERSRNISDVLVRAGGLEPLNEENDADLSKWLAWELASLVEGRFDQVVDCSALTADERSNWLARATYRGAGVSEPSSCYQTGYWIVQDDQRVGTLALGSLSGRCLLPIGSLYVEPTRRCQGVASRALERCYEAALQFGVPGISLRTEWTWTRALRFYVARQFWVRMWKHEIVLMRMKELPPYRLTFTGNRAQFQIQEHGVWTALIESKRSHTRLQWQELDACIRRREDFDEVHCYAAGTFALNLALLGWPLIRSSQAWQDRYKWSDGGEPEGLAYKIQVFEAVARSNGYNVATPRIPGLAYPDLEQLNSM